MTFLKRDVLQAFGDTLEGDDKAAFKTVLDSHEFSSERNAAATYESDFQRDLEHAGLTHLRERLASSYYEIVKTMN